MAADMICPNCKSKGFPSREVWHWKADHKIKCERCGHWSPFQDWKIPGVWIKVADCLPRSGVLVLAFVAPNEYGKTRIIRAEYADPKTLEQSPDCDGGVYDEETDTYYCEEGWYESNEYEEIHWNVGGVVTHWMSLPMPPTE